VRFLHHVLVPTAEFLSPAKGCRSYIIYGRGCSSDGANDPKRVFIEYTTGKEGVMMMTMMMMMRPR